MVVSNKEKGQSSSTSKGEKSVRNATSSKSSTSNVKTISTTSTTSTVSSQKNISQTGGTETSVIISEVYDSNSGAIDDNALRTIQTQYVVSQPEINPPKVKEHYIYGGTQIIEMGTTMGSEMLSREKNKSSWNGKFIYEGTPERTNLKSWESEHVVITEPGTSSSTTTKTTKTNEENIKSGGGGGGVPSKSSKLVADTLKQQSKTAAGTSAGQDLNDAAAATDLLLESERCIAKKAYITTDKTDGIASSSVSNIESQILTTNTDAKTEKNDRYPISTMPSHSSGDVQSTSIADTNTMLKADNSNQFSTEQYSSSFSKSSRSEKSSLSNQLIEIIDGKERVISDTFNESGSMKSKISSENFTSKAGTGIKPEIDYDHKVAEESISFHNDKRDKQPIYDREYHDFHQNIKKRGDNAPLEHFQVSHETTRYDDNAKKYITDVQQRENNRQLDNHTTSKDGIPLKYDVAKSTLQIDDHSKIDTKNSKTIVDDNRSNTFESVKDSGSTQTTTKSDSYDNKSTTYTSKLYETTSNILKTLDESNISNVNKRSTVHKPMHSDHYLPAKNIDSKSVTASTSLIEKNTTVNKGLAKDSKTLLDKRTANDHKITKLNNSTKSMTQTTNQKISQHLYDEKTKSWREVDEKTIKSKRPSLIRYVSKDTDGKFTTIYKRKLFDKKSGTWKVVDEKIYKNNNFNEHIPEVIEDETNITTTTYTTKVFDNKTNTWRIVDEQTFTDRNTQVPKDIAEELARDKPDIANITTTTELTKIFDATTNTWKIVNERSHTDFVEKIVETPRERIIIDDITDITKIKSINDRTERTTDITDITDINTVKNTYNIHETEETILREVTKENDVRDTSTIINKSIDVVDRSENILSDDIITTERQTTLVEGGPRKQPKPADEKKPKAKPTAAQNEQCICEICTCGRHRCTHEQTTDNQLITDSTSIETKSAYRKDFIDKHVTSYDTIRTPTVKPVDNLKPEGDIEFTDKKPYKPAEKVIATRPKDNLFVSGEFTDVTTTKTEFNGDQVFERTTPVRRNTWTKLEGDLTTTTTSQTEFVDYKDTFERTTLTQKHVDNLVIEGQNDFTTTNKTDFTDQEITYQRPRKRTWTKDDYEKFHHQDDEQTFVRTDETTTVFDIKDIRETVKIPADNLKMSGPLYTPEKQPIKPAEKRTPIKHDDNLRPEGDFERPEKPSFKPAERPQQVKPTDNLRMTGEFTRVDKTEFISAERPQQIKPEDNLRPEGDFHTPEKPRFGPAEKRTPIKHDDNLRPEGTFERPEKPSFKPAERPQQVKPTDNLRMTGEFTRVEKTEFISAERPQQIKPEDNLRPEGDFYTPEKPRFGPAEKRTPIKHDDNLHPEGVFERPEKPSFKPAERPQQVKPTDNLKMSGEFVKPDKSEFIPADRPKQVRPQDNLRPEGEIYSPEKQSFGPAERRTPIKHDDNLRPEGTFERPEKPSFKPAERPQQVKPTDNLKMTGDFIRVERTEFTPAERPKQVRPEDNLHPEGDFYTPKDKLFGPAEKRKPIKHDDNLRPEGTFERPEKPSFKPAERPQQFKPTDNLRMTGEFTRVEKTEFISAERPQQIKPEDNLRPEGDFYTPEKQRFSPAERPKQIKPQDNLKPEGEFQTPQKVGFKPAERPEQVKPADNLYPEGSMYTTPKQQFGPAEKRSPFKYDDNLHPEGSFDRPEKHSFKPAERPKQVKPTDNLKMTGEFTRVEKTEYVRSERPQQVKPQDNLKPEGKFQVPEKPGFKPADRPKQVKPQDNLKQTGTFYSPDKQKYIPAERPKQVKPQDNLQVTGKFEGRRKSDTVITKVDRATIKKHVDQISLNEGKMETDTTNSSTFKKVKPQRNVVEDIVKKQKMRSNITLGDDTSILRTTNQMNYNTVTTRKDQTVERSTDVTDSKRIKDGTIAITTMKVTTILENEKDHTPIKEIIRNEGRTNIREDVVHNESGTDVLNKRNVINQEHHMKEVHQNVVNRRFIVNENDVKNIQETKSGQVTSSIDKNIVNTTRKINSNTQVTDSNQIRANQHYIVTDKYEDNVNRDEIMRQNASGPVINKDGLSKSDTNTMTSTTRREQSAYDLSENNKHLSSSTMEQMSETKKSSEQTISSKSINRGGNENVVTERTMITSTPITSRQQDYTSDILNVNDARSSKKSLAKTSQSEMINNQMNLRQHEATSTRHTKTSSSNASNYSTSNISSVLYESDQSFPMHKTSTSTAEQQQKRDYVSSNASLNHGQQLQSENNKQQMHHRKNILTSSTDVNNSVFHRKANLSTNSNEALHSNSMSKTAAIQRKSISNLHDQAIYSNASSDRKSFSSLHRQGKESTSYGGSSSHSTSHITTSKSSSNIKQSSSAHERTQNIVGRDNLSLGGEFYGRSESKAYGNFGHQHHAADRAIFSRRSNQSSISIGDGQNHSSSVYRREFAVVHSGPCPADQLDKKATFTHTRDTKSHKFYKSSFQ